MSAGTNLESEVWPAEAFEKTDACPYCGSGRHVAEIHDVEDWFFSNVPGGFTFERCEGCFSLWMSTRPTPSYLPLAYATYYTHSTASPPVKGSGFKARLRDSYIRTRFGQSSGGWDALGSAIFRTLSTDRTHLDARFRYAPSAPSRILDYGCGGGEYLRLMRDLGHDVVGVDFDEAALEPLRNDGITALSAHEAAQRDWTASFDCITLNHVIEHVADPVQLLQSLAEMLKPGGVFYLEAPNASAAGLEVFGKYWRGLEAPRHLAIPSRKGLREILAKAGLVEERWLLRGWVRELIWPASLNAVPDAERSEYEARSRRAPDETLENTEYLIVVARKL